LNRDEKAAVVDEIAAQIEGSEAIFAIDYRGISVPEAAALRGDLREADTSFRVVKNRLTKLAAEKAGREELSELLEGPTALAFIRGDTAMAAKAISTFNREHDVLAFKGGFMEGLTLDQETFASIARLPSRDVLNGQFAGVVASPLTGLVRGLGSMVSGLAVALQQIADQGLVAGEPPAAPDADADSEGADASAAGPVPEEDTSSSQAAGEEPTSAPPAEEASKDEAPEPALPETEAEAPQAEAASKVPEPQPDADPDTPGSEAEDVSGSDSEASSATGPAAEASEDPAEEPEATDEPSDEPEASNEEE
jgi:large subunit ribosomal protein L10